MSSTTAKLTYRTGTKSFANWLQADNLGDDTQRELAKANMLLVPGKDHLSGDQLCFPEGTEQFLNFLRKNRSSDLIVDICIEDNDYRELMLHDDSLGLSHFLVMSSMYPIVINLISSYLYERLGLKVKKTVLRVDWTVVDDHSGKSIDFHYEGSASDYEEKLRSTVAEVRKLLK